MTHSTAVSWSYLVLLTGVSIVILGIMLAVYGARSSRSPGSGSSARNRLNSEDPQFRKRMEMLEEQMRAGRLTREEYNRRRTEILVERYKRHAS